ncbi:MAG: hypothetical protein EPN94_12125 [Nitrospirae bacterium]|nr:MAG: hypothetical protein EPN94_12125 [Nitrospirota bacterium]
MTTLENTGKYIFEHRLPDGSVFSIEDNQCKDVEDDAALLLLKDYPQLKVIAVSKSTLESVNAATKFVQDEVEKVEETKEDPFLESMAKEETHGCSMCASTFSSNLKMRNHMKKEHGA